MRAPLKRLQRFACAVLVAASFQGIQSAHADWANFGTVSMTDATHPKLTNQYACYTDGRDIICDTGVGPIHVGPNGMINSGGMTVAGSVSASAVSATYVSTTVLQINPSTMPCSTGLNGTIRYSSTSNTLEVCAGTTWSTLSSNTTPGNLSGSGSATAVAFWNGPNSLTYESATTSGLYWDANNKRLGINTNTPSRTVYVSDSVDAILEMAPAAADSGFADILLSSGGDVSGSTWQLSRRAKNQSNDFWIANYPGGVFTPRVTVDTTGNVGIGIITPTSTLQVSGTFTVSNSAQGSTSPSIFVDAAGNVGMGTNAPSTPLFVTSNVSTAVVAEVGVTNKFALVARATLSSATALGAANTATGYYANLGGSNFSVYANGPILIGTGTVGSSLTVANGEIQTASSGAACVSATNGGAIRYSAGTLYYCNGSNTWASITGGGAGFTGGGSATAVAFWNGPNSLTYESTTTSGLYWDHANGRLGIGTNVPGSALEVSTGTGGIRVNMNTSALPAFMADTSADNLVYLRLKKGGKIRWDLGANSVAESGSDVGSDFYVNRFADNEAYLSTPLLIQRSSGNIGVGTTAPYATLQVSGTFTVSTTGQNSLASASLAVDSRGVSVSSIVHITGSAFSPIGAGGNAILSGTTAVSTSSAGSITFYAGGKQAMAIASTGAVGIGTSAPTRTLDVSGSIAFRTGLYSSSLSNFYLSDNIGTGYPGINFDAADFIDYRRDVDMLRMSVAGNIRAFIDNAGAFWVGASTSAPATQINQGGIGLNNNAAASGYWFLGFYRSGTAIGSVTQNGTTGVAYNTTSDRRMKDDITDSREGLEKLMQLPVRDFAFKADPSHTIVTGFIAQELNKVFPEAVTTNGDNGETPLKDKSKPWSVDYGRVTPLIVKAVQDLKHMFDVENEDLAQLKADNDNLRILVKTQQTQIGSLAAANDAVKRRLEKLEARLQSR